MSSSADTIRWRAAVAPKLWSPERAGESLVGRFVGYRAAPGPYRDFELVLIRSLDGTVWSVSGALCVDQVKAAGIASGELIKLVFQGNLAVDHVRVCERTHYMRAIDVFVEDRDDA